MSFIHERARAFSLCLLGLALAVVVAMMTPGPVLAQVIQSCKGRTWLLDRLRHDMPGARIEEMRPTCYVPHLRRLPEIGQIHMPEALFAFTQPGNATVRLVSFRGECHLWSGYLSIHQHRVILQAAARCGGAITA